MASGWQHVGRIGAAAVENVVTAWKVSIFAPIVNVKDEDDVS